MSTDTSRYVSPVDDEPLMYRALSKAAIASFAFGLLSILVIPTALSGIDGFLMTVGLPVAGIVIGLAAVRKIRKSPNEWTGLNLARIGTTLSGLLLIVGASTAAYVYATEVPDGSLRVTFTSLRPEYETGAKATVAGKLPPEILALDGQQIFIKGYMREPAYQYNIDKFLFVRDDKTCCFGPIDNVQFWDQIAVKMSGDLRADYSKRMFRMAGVLRVHPERVGSSTREPVFEMEANYIR